MSITNQTAFDLPGDFTIELWWYPTSLTGTQALIGKWGATNFAWLVQATSTTITLQTNSGNAGTTTISNAWTPSIGRWFHIAFTRSGTSIKAYINGSQVGTTQTSSKTCSSTATLGIGANPDGPQEYTSGYISNIRIIKGQSLTTGDFTPPTLAVNGSSVGWTGANVAGSITGTVSLLTCQSNRFIDNSTNNFTITVNGTPSVVAFSPFNPTSAWSASTVGGSGYFDGTGDYLSNTSSSIVPTTGDFTIEGWFYPSQVSTLQYIFATGGGTRLDVYINSSAYIGVQTGGSYRDSSTTKIIANAWNYIAITRTGSTYAIFVNGVSQTIAGTGTMASTITNTPTYIGTYSGTTNNFTGYICGLRVSTVVRTGLTTLPTSPYTSDANTSLLLNFTNAGIYDATSKNDLETVGNAQISTTQSKWGGSSMAFDGTGDYLQSPDTELLEFGSGDFTIETWVRFNALPSSGAFYSLISKFDNSTQKSYSFYVYNNAGTYQLYFTYTTNGSTNINPVANGITVTTNTWYHYAVSRSGVNLRLFIDGTQVGSTYNIATDTIFGGTYPVQVGASTGANTLNGYLQDLRVTKGYARYTANFTPPTAAFAQQ